MVALMGHFKSKPIRTVPRRLKLNNETFFFKYHHLKLVQKFRSIAALESLKRTEKLRHSAKVEFEENGWEKWGGVGEGKASGIGRG